MSQLGSLQKQNIVDSFLGQMISDRGSNHASADNHNLEERVLVISDVGMVQMSENHFTYVWPQTWKVLSEKGRFVSEECSFFLLDDLKTPDITEPKTMQPAWAYAPLPPITPFVGTHLVLVFDGFALSKLDGGCLEILLLLLHLRGKLTLWRTGRHS